MDAKELRIGNYINDEETTHIVVGVDSFIIQSYWLKDVEREDLYGTPLSRIKPIELTDEILIKFGFELKLGNYELPNFRFHINKPMNYNGFLFCEGYSVLTDKIKYVHQLQNLYFALTGNELAYEMLT